MEQARYREEHKGEKYLDLLGLGALIGQQFVGRDGARHDYRDFLDHCGPQAQEVLAGLEAIGPDDPRFEVARQAVRDSVMQHILPSQSGA